jgi:ABC-type nitrate/sulfonate/bicarbonate transport system substrate-binding protein
MDTTRTTRGGIAVLLAALLVAGGAAAAYSQAPKYVVRFGIVGVPSTTYYAPLVVAQQKGFFAEQGVRIDQTIIGPDDNLVRAVAGNALDLGIPEASIAINGNAHGAPVKVIACLTDRYPYNLYARPAIKSYADLRGKTIAHWTVAPEASTALIRRLLASHGVAEGQYNLVAGGGLAARYAALTKGAVDAAILTAPFNLLAQQQGLTDLGGLFDIPAVFACVIDNTNWAAQHRDAVVATLKALIMGFRYTANPANKAEVVAMLATLGHLDPAVVGQTYDQFYRTQTYLTSWDLAPSPRSMQGVVDILSSLGQLPKGATPQPYFDLSYLHTALTQVAK